jgi:hypothetical protein
MRSGSLAAWTLLCLLLPATNAQVCDQDCQQAQRAALEGLYASLGGARWRRAAGWGAAPDHCSWQGVTCCAPAQAPGCAPAGGVVALDLASNGLEGSLPAGAFAGLEPSLEALNLFDNLIAGPLPESLGALRRLKVLLVSGNALAGALPGGVGALPRLTQFDFGDNAFSGACSIGVCARRVCCCVNVPVSPVVAGAQRGGSGCLASAFGACVDRGSRAMARMGARGDRLPAPGRQFGSSFRLPGLQQHAQPRPPPPAPHPQAPCQTPLPRTPRCACCAAPATASTPSPRRYWRRPPSKRSTSAPTPSGARCRWRGARWRGARWR